MTLEQRKLLLQLAATLNKLSDECLNDDNFNDLIYELGVFKVSLEEATASIYFKL